MSESELQVAVAEYIAWQYPKVLFHSDFGSGVKLTAGQARLNSRQNAGRRAWPDMFIAKPVYSGWDGSTWHGLFLELKKDGTRLRKRNGEWATGHIAEQAATLNALNHEGYLALFAVGFDMAKAIIDHYLNEYEMTDDDGYVITPSIEPESAEALQELGTVQLLEKMQEDDDFDDIF